MSNCMEADMTAEQTYIDTRHMGDPNRTRRLTAARYDGKHEMDTLGHTGLGVYKGLL